MADWIFAHYPEKEGSADIEPPLHSNHHGT